MPMLDVSAALTNPITLSMAVVARRQEFISSTGRSKPVVTFVNIMGVIYPEGDNALSRRADTQNQGKGIAVITRYALRGATGPSPVQGYQPDMVKWNGAAFIVATVEDYSQYGRGFIRAHCVAIDITQFPAEVKP